MQIAIVNQKSSGGRKKRRKYRRRDETRNENKNKDLRRKLNFKRAVGGICRSHDVKTQKFSNAD